MERVHTGDLIQSHELIHSEQNRPGAPDHSRRLPGGISPLPNGLPAGRDSRLESLAGRARPGGASAPPMVSPRGNDAGTGFVRKETAGFEQAPGSTNRVNSTGTPRTKPTSSTPVQDVIAMLQALRVAPILSHRVNQQKQNGQGSNTPRPNRADTSSSQTQLKTFFPSRTVYRTGSHGGKQPTDGQNRPPPPVNTPRDIVEQQPTYYDPAGTDEAIAASRSMLDHGRSDRTLAALRARELEVETLQKRREEERRQSKRQSKQKSAQMASIEEQMSLMTEQQRRMRENQEVLIRENRELKSNLE